MGSKATPGLAVPKPTLRVNGPVKAFRASACLYRDRHEWPNKQSIRQGRIQFSEKFFLKMRLLGSSALPFPD